MDNMVNFIAYNSEGIALPTRRLGVEGFANYVARGAHKDGVVGIAILDGAFLVIGDDGGIVATH